MKIKENKEQEEETRRKEIKGEDKMVNERRRGKAGLRLQEC